MAEKRGTNEGTLWGGRFESGPSNSLQKLSKSTQFDWILTPYDLRGSKAHATALFDADIISESDYTVITAVLNGMLADYEAGTLLPNDTDEDVHGALERILLERAGAEIGGKLRAGRSRNDQIATLIRMYLRESATLVSKQLIALLDALANQAKKALVNPVIMPGRTHLQHAQPVLLSHHLLAHGWAFFRDLDRLRSWGERVNYSPYGSGALAGQSLGLDASKIAKDLGFLGVEPNSIDATASRDFVAEFAFIMSMIAINLSRLSEEIILWNTKEFDFVKLDDSFSTGSSIMPQKKNPDIAELTRGKSGRIIGDLTGLLVTLKGLPLAYNRDLQEDKEPVFDQISQLLDILPAFAGQIETLTFNYERLQYLAHRGFALATDIAEFLVKQGVPFRNAHEIAGECVKLCEERTDQLGKEYELWDLEDSDFEKLLPIENASSVRSVLSATGSVNARNNSSGTAPSSVKAQLINFTKKVNDFRR